jgi:hypothetical protein
VSGMLSISRALTVSVVALTSGIGTPAAQVSRTVIGSETAGVSVTSEHRAPEQDLAVHPRLELVEISEQTAGIATMERVRRHSVGPSRGTGTGFAPSTSTSTDGFRQRRTDGLSPLMPRFA